jgi:ubiquitin carboxyl-terminal hydrolase 25
MHAKRYRQSTFLVENLSKLFAQMIMANRKYVDPTQVLRSLTDDFGNFIHVGEQRDIGEFNLNFLERIEEGLGELKKPENHNSAMAINQNQNFE